VSRMIDLIKQSAVPATVMRSAARGALSLPSGEVVEILVHLSGHDLFAEQAKLSLAGYDLAAMKQIAGDPKTPVEVLSYLAAPENVRPALLPTLLENPTVSQTSLLQLAQSHSSDVLAALLASPRVQKQQAVLRVVIANHALPFEKKAEAEALLETTTVDADPSLTAEDLLEIEGELSKYLHEHSAEIAAEEAKGFELVDLSEDEKRELQAQTNKLKATADAEAKKRMSPLQKIAGLAVGDRVQLAMKGNREERFILIRDGCKVVSSAVLECPKLTDQEVETFAAMKNVQESVLRAISGKRKFMKLYAVMRALSANPRCPLDVALPILKNLLIQDLRNLSTNKNVPDTLRKVAFKMFKEKTSANKKSD
jgi:hypothetical protein